MANDSPDIPDYSKLNDNQIKVQVGKTITGIMSCLKTGTPLDFSNFKAMHKDTPIFNIIHNKSKNDNETNFELYIKEVDKQLQLLELKLVPIYEKPTDAQHRMDRTDIRNPQKIAVNILAGFLVTNEAATMCNISNETDIENENQVQNEIFQEMKNLAKEDKRDSTEYQDCLKLLDQQIEGMKLCNLIKENDNMFKYLKCKILGFIFTRAFELGSDHGQFWNEENPLESFVTLRDLNDFLKSTMGLSVPTDLDKDGQHDIRFHSDGKAEKGFLKKFITGYLKDQRYINLFKCDHVRDTHLYDGESEEGKQIVRWDVRAIAEFDIEDILTAVSAFICEDAYPSWMQDKDFMGAVKAFQSECNQVRDLGDNDEIEGVFKNWDRKMQPRARKKKSKK